jgi:hypothetical protein
MDEQLDIVSSGPRQRRGARRHGPGRGGWIAIFAVAALLGSLVVTTRLALVVAHRNDTINSLRAALRKAGYPAPAAAVRPAVFMLPDAGGGSFSVVAAAVRADPGSAAHTWLLVYGRNAIPGQRYGLIEDTCGGQYVAAYGVASGVADRHGDLTISAPDLAISPQAPDVWIQLYRWEDGAPLGGVQGPLTGSGAKTFRTAPAC